MSVGRIIRIRGVSTCSGRRKTAFPKTMTFPDSSKIFANSTPWSWFSHASTQIRKNSEYWTELSATFLSFAFTFSICAALRIFRAFSTDIPLSAWPAIGAATPLLMPLSASRSFSPIGKEKNSGSRTGLEWYTARRRNETRRRKPLSSELSCGMIGGTIGGDAALETMARWNDVVVLKLSKQRLAKSFWNAMDESCECFLYFYYCIYLFLSLFWEKERDRESVSNRSKFRTEGFWDSW